MTQWVALEFRPWMLGFRIERARIRAVWANRTIGSDGGDVVVAKEILALLDMLDFPASVARLQELYDAAHDWDRIRYLDALQDFQNLTLLAESLEVYRPKMIELRTVYRNTEVVRELPVEAKVAQVLEECGPLDPNAAIGTLSLQDVNDLVRRLAQQDLEWNNTDPVLLRVVRYPYSTRIPNVERK